MTICTYCKADPCLSEVHGDMLRSLVGTINESWTDNRQRKVLYREFIRAHHGYLGRDIRKKAPDCVVELIHTLIPNPDGIYMGHKWTRDEDENGDNDDVAMEFDSASNNKSNDEVQEDVGVRIYWTFDQFPDAGNVASAFVSTLPKSNDWIIGYDSEAAFSTIVLDSKEEKEDMITHCLGRLGEYSGLDTV